MSFDHSVVENNATAIIPLDLIDEFANGGNVRRKRNRNKFAELCASIQRKGVTQSVTVRPSPFDDTRFELLAGYGRVDACRNNGLNEIPAIIKVVDDNEALEIMLEENTVREDLGIVDEILACQRYVELFNGDYEEASKRLGWPVNKIKARIVLAKLSKKVLDALDQGKIKIGHAEILSQFSVKLQEGTLAKLLDENWTVEYLKERAGRAQSILRKAVFDTTECKSCPHNSDLQASLFDEHIGKAKCGNFECWKKKTDAYLETRKKELEADYGKVLFLVEKKTGRNTTSPEAVGEEQYNEGCLGCEKRVVILNDERYSEGKVITDQCIDTTCFKKCVTALEKANEPEPSQKSNHSPDPKSAIKDKPKQKAKSSPKGQLPKAVMEYHRKEFRANTKDLLASDKEYQNLITTAGLIHSAGANHFKSLNVAGRSVASIAIALHSKPAEELISLQAKAIELIASVTQDSFGCKDFEALPAVIAKANEKVKQEAIKNWSPSKENLGAYLKDGLIKLLKDAGFDSAFTAKGGNKKAPSFEKLSKRAKGDIVEAALELDFDWSGFAPKEYIGLLS